MPLQNAMWQALGGLPRHPGEVATPKCHTGACKAQPAHTPGLMTRGRLAEEPHAGLGGGLPLVTPLGVPCLSVRSAQSCTGCACKL